MKPILCWLLVLSGAAAAEPTEVAAFLERLGRATAPAETLVVEFVQDRHLALFDEPLRTEGWLVFQKPGSLRWEVATPYRSILISTGNQATQFEETDGAWKRFDLSFLKSIPSFVSGMALFLEGRYASRPDEYGFALRQEDGPVLVLTPKQPAAAQVVAALELHFGEDLKRGATQIVMRQPGGDWTSIRFTNQIANVRLPPGTFDHQQPAGLAAIREAAGEQQGN